MNTKMQKEKTNALKLNEKLKKTLQVYFGQAWFQLLAHFKVRM
jgi:hypothetical protein